MAYDISPLPPIVAPVGSKTGKNPTHDPSVADTAVNPPPPHPTPVFKPPVPEIESYPRRYQDGYHSFSGAEVVVSASVNGVTVPLTDITTLSYSVYRDKYEVKTLGNSNVRGRTRGTRTVAGTIIFVHTQEHPLLKLMRNKTVRTTFSGSYYSDEIIPIDLTMTFVQSILTDGVPDNMISRIALRGVEFNTESATWSIHQPLTEMTVQYVALGVEPMVGNDAAAPGQALERVPELHTMIDDQPDSIPSVQNIAIDEAQRQIDAEERMFNSLQIQKDFIDHTMSESTGPT